MASMNTHAVVGNVQEEGMNVKAGALCYVTNFSLATGSVEVSVIDADGNWISQWRPGTTMTNFRAKVVHKGHPAFSSALNVRAAKGRAATLASAFGAAAQEAAEPTEQSGD